ncbi:TRAP transporter substrate-binding protein DctP [Psychromonas sp. KJ10-10]|uniref:TRAP transporter substrate-binding protein DctP n=1 Tax=Psychromonas sp. KJ10-10 TaxID=3391823 RepID=UPI0039B39E01
MQTDWFKGLEGQLADTGLQMVVPDVVYGTRHLLSKKKVEKPADLKGVKVRVQHSRLMVATVEAMGGVPAPMSLSDVYPGLSQGVIDGVENPAVVLHGGKFYEVAKNLSLTGHIKMLSPFVAGTGYWNNLTSEERKIITETSRDMVKYGATLINELEKEAFDKMKAEGVQINEVDAKAFADVAGDVVQKAFPEWTPNLYKDIQKKLSDM